MGGLTGAGPALQEEPGTIGCRLAQHIPTQETKKPTLEQEQEFTFSEPSEI